jgi:iron-sulfur cluster repair protein YtfE (RIC family)
MDDVKKLTDIKIQERMSELGEKYKKLMKVGRKLSDEMASLHEEYEMLRNELETRIAQEEL